MYKSKYSTSTNKLLIENIQFKTLLKFAAVLNQSEDEL